MLGTGAAALSSMLSVQQCLPLPKHRDVCVSIVTLKTSRGHYIIKPRNYYPTIYLIVTLSYIILHVVFDL